jgi:hypothetical protein
MGVVICAIPSLVDIVSNYKYLSEAYVVRVACGVIAVILVKKGVECCLNDD